MVPLVVSYVLVAALTFASARKRSGAADPRNRGSSRLLAVTHTVGFITPAICAAFRIGRLPIGSAFAWGAVALQVGAIALQLWAMTTLGESFTVTLRTTSGQRIVRSGPYRRLRHPAYLGQILFWLGLAAASRSAVSLAVVAVVVIIGYGYRIHVEELMLARSFGHEYAEYRRATWRLLPGVW